MRILHDYRGSVRIHIYHDVRHTPVLGQGSMTLTDSDYGQCSDYTLDQNEPMSLS